MCTCEPINNNNAPFRMQYSMETKSKYIFKRINGMARKPEAFIFFSFNEKVLRWWSTLLKSYRKHTQFVFEQQYGFIDVSNKIKVWSVWSA